MPLQTTEGITLLAREILDFNFLKFTQALRQISHASFMLHALRGKAHFPSPLRG